MAVNPTSVQRALRSEERDPARPPAPGTTTIRRPTRLMEAASVRNHWHIKVAEGVTPKDLADVSYFGHVQRTLRVGDRIEAEAYDGSWLAELRVQASEAGSVRVHQLHLHEFKTARAGAPPVVPAGYRVAFGSEATKWRVTRTADSRMLREGFDDEASALAWLNKHVTEMSIA